VLACPRLALALPMAAPAAPPSTVVPVRLLPLLMFLPTTLPTTAPMMPPMMARSRPALGLVAPVWPMETVWMSVTRPISTAAGAVCTPALG
jgi:hypothetical protein